MREQADAQVLTIPIECGALIDAASPRLAFEFEEGESFRPDFLHVRCLRNKPMIGGSPVTFTLFIEGSDNFADGTQLQYRTILAGPIRLEQLFERMSLPVPKATSAVALIASGRGTLRRAGFSYSVSECHPEADFAVAFEVTGHQFFEEA